MLPLQIRQLAVCIDNKALLHNIDLTLADKGVSILMGHNGAGKSLLLRCMHGLIEPAAGSLQWAGIHATDINSRHRQAMVFQKPLMLNRSVAGNILYVLKLRNKPKDRLQQHLQTAELESQSRQSARSLSGGEQQRLAIARALACEPEVLFLDEPTANLDPEATQKIESQIHHATGKSIKVIMVTHDVAQARRIADDVVFIHKGAITEHTKAKTFFTTPESKQAHDYLAAYVKPV